MKLQKVLIKRASAIPNTSRLFYHYESFWVMTEAADAMAKQFGDIFIVTDEIKEIVELKAHTVIRPEPSKEK